MADYELNGNGNNIEYMNGGGSNPATAVQNAMGLFLKGGIGADGKSYPQVDLSLWDQATMCGTCHVGSPFYEQDRQGTRLPARLFQDWAAAMTQSGPPKINPLTTTVWESYDPATGAQTSKPTFAPWAYPQFAGNNPAGDPVLAPNGWVPMDMQMADPNTGQMMNLKKGQLMMPNVKEMDCLFCHLKGYDNIAASVMTQAGSLNAAPAAGAGLFDMMPLSPTYMGYNGRAVTFADAGNGMLTVTLSGAVTGNILPKPDENNCHQCHATKTLKDFPEMFGVTGTSTGFLSSTPMVYDPPGYGPLGKRMVNFDINSPFLFSGTSPVIDGSNVYSYMMTGLTYPQAQGASPYNHLTAGQLGGGNMAQTGPLYYFNSANAADQDTLKRSTMPFPRAEWFKRGDAWQSGQDVHATLTCSGCHYTDDGNDPAAHKSQCDPGRGFDMMGSIQDGVPPLKNRNLVTNADGTVETPDKHDTRNTVKRCEFCHVTGKDYYGRTINTFGAPNPNVKHQNAGLTANIVQIVDNKDIHGTFGGQGVSDNTDFTTPGKTTLDRGNHLDVMDCTVCHVQKESMAVRVLDATSGMRFPSIIGTEPQKGMMGLFEDPAPDSFNDGVAMQMNQMYQALGMPLIPQDPNNPGHFVHTIGGKLQQWKPLMVWQRLGNLELPLTTNLGPGANFSNSANADLSAYAGQPKNFRRKIYLSNPIVAAIWNNADPAVDANGDGAPGGLLNNSKPSLAGYRDIFTGDPLNRNNTQGYDEPIFDPWIMRDLKEGFNFAPSALSVISAGFGNGSYASAYNPDGTFTGAFNYVSVWSGAVVLTEPEQIRSYKDMRTGMNPQKPWTGTQLSLVGDPFMVTHGVRPTATFAKGKSCADCHAQGAGFFKGDFVMTGSAIPASASFDPTAQLQTNMSDTADANTFAPILDAKGDPIRNPGAMNGAFASNSNMMMRPLEPYRVKAFKGDLRTAFEGFNKLGQPRTTKFEQDVTVNGQVYTYTVPMQRSDALYPEEDGAIYYKAGDVDPVSGAVRPGATPLDGRAYADYLETGISLTLADYGVGATPNASFSVTDADAATLGTQVFPNQPVGLTVAYAQPNSTNTADIGSVAYSWSTNDAGAVIVNGNTKAPSITFTTAGSKTITLTATNLVTGVSSVASVTVTAAMPPMGIAWNHDAKTVSVANLPDTTKYVKIYWGDGAVTSQTLTVGTTATSATHSYTTTTSKTIQVYAYNSAGTKVGFNQATVNP